MQPPLPSSLRSRLTRSASWRFVQICLLSVSLFLSSATVAFEPFVRLHSAAKLDALRFFREKKLAKKVRHTGRRLLQEALQTKSDGKFKSPPWGRCLCCQGSQAKIDIRQKANFFSDL